jgi:indolepyruvate ferredoxin oxidoreductase alpha subunit
MILDNSTTGMTGHQDHAATGKTLMGEETNAINITMLCKAIGIKNVIEVNAFDVELLEKIMKEETAKDEISVIITKSPCVLLNKAPIKEQCYVDPDKCKKCGMCLKPGCPAITKAKEGFVVINDTMCTGCDLCRKLCKFGAITRVEK